MNFIFLTDSIPETFSFICFKTAICSEQTTSLPPVFNLKCRFDVPETKITIAFACAPAARAKRRIHQNKIRFYFRVEQSFINSALYCAAYTLEFPVIASAVREISLTSTRQPAIFNQMARHPVPAEGSSANEFSVGSKNLDITKAIRAAWKIADKLFVRCRANFASVFSRSDFQLQEFRIYFY